MVDSLRYTIQQAFKTPFYKKLFGKIGLTTPDEIRHIEDFRKIPFTTKDDLRNWYPDGFLAVDKSDVVRLHASSGTTGMPTVIYHTKKDIDNWTALCCRSLMGIGASKHDIFQNMMSYGLFTGGLGLHYGAESLGMLVIPSGPGNTKRQIQLIKDFHTTVVHATPSYLLHLAEEAEREGIEPTELSIRKAIVGAEPHSEKIRMKIEALYGAEAYNSYGMSEMNGPGVAFECTIKNGMHIWEDSYHVETINPETGNLLADGEEGELVLTTLKREATPLVRYRTRDLTRIIPEPCPCGLIHRRINRIKGRSDDMLIINGVNLFPMQIETILMHYPETGGNYQIEIEKKESLDKIKVKVECSSSSLLASDRNLLQKKIHDDIKSACIVNAQIEIMDSGTLPVSSTGKAVRVVDLRKDRQC